MPRTADHDAQRERIVRAAITLIARDGVDAATMAATAREAGLSVGAMQHYFASKAQILARAFTDSRAAVWQRVNQGIAQGEESGKSVGEIVQDSMLEMLPLTDQSREEYRVKVAFSSELSTSEVVLHTYRQEIDDMRSVLAQALRNAQRCGEVEKDRDVDLDAENLVAQIEGLATLAFLDPDPTLEHYRRLLDRALRVIFTGYCTTHGRPALSVMTT